MSPFLSIILEELVTESLHYNNLHLYKDPNIFDHGRNNRHPVYSAIWTASAKTHLSPMSLNNLTAYEIVSINRYFVLTD